MCAPRVDRPKRIIMLVRLAHPKTRAYEFFHRAGGQAAQQEVSEDLRARERIRRFQKAFILFSKQPSTGNRLVLFLKKRKEREIVSFATVLHLSPIYVRTRKGRRMCR